MRPCVAPTWATDDAGFHPADCLGHRHRGHLCQPGARAGPDLPRDGRGQLRSGRDGNVLDLHQLLTDRIRALRLLERVRGHDPGFLRARRRDRTPSHPAVRGCTRVDAPDRHAWPLYHLQRGHRTDLGLRIQGLPWRVPQHAGAVRRPLPQHPGPGRHRRGSTGAPSRIVRTGGGEAGVRRLPRVRPELLGLAVIGGIVVLGVPTVTNQFITFEFAKVAIFAIALMGLNLLTGYSGQISLGNGAFMAVGGYTTAILVQRTGIPYWTTIPVAALVAGGFGFVIGIPALRLTGVYLALATFALALSVPPVLNHYDTFTGGHGGIVMPAVLPPFSLDLSQEQWLYYMDSGIALLLFVFAWGVVRSRTGRAFMAIRDSETAATASGISLAYYKTLAFGLSAAYAGVAGSLLAIATSYLNPDTFGLSLSLALLVGVVIGGLGLDFGAVFGSLFVVWLPYYAEKASGLHIGALSFAGKPDIFYGALLIVILFFALDGAAGLLPRAWRCYLHRRTAVRSPLPDPVAER